MNREDTKRQIYGIEDRIRLAPDETPNRTIYEWYLEIDRLREQLDDESDEGIASDRMSTIEESIDKLQKRLDDTSDSMEPDQRERLEAELNNLQYQLGSLDDKFMPPSDDVNANEL